MPRSPLLRRALPLLLTSALAGWLAWPRSPAPRAAPATPSFPAAVRDAVATGFRPARDGFVTAGGRQRVHVDPSGVIAVSSGGAPVRLQTVELNGEPVPARAVTLDRQSGALAIDRVRVVEELRNGAGGLEQQWRFDSAPEVDGELEVLIALGGATAEGMPDGARLVGADGERLRYSHATFVDADGRRTRVPVRARSDALALVVPAEVLRSARYPAVLDPLVSAESQVDAPVPSTYAGNSACTVSFDGTNFLVAWEDERLGTFGWDPLLVATRVTPSGTVLDPAGIVVSAEDAFSIASVSSTFDGTNFVLAWKDARNSHSTGLGHADVYAARISPAGKLLDPNNLRVTPTQMDVGGVDVASNGSVSLVVFNLGYETKQAAARLDKAGRVLDPALVTVETMPGFSNPPKVASDGTDFLVVWGRYGGSATNDDLFARRVSGTGAPLGSTFTVTAATGKQTLNGIAYSPTAGQYLVTWEDGRNSTKDAYGARVTRAGSVQDTSGLVIAGSTTVSEYQPRVAWDGTQYRVVFTQIGGGSSVQTTTVSTGGAVGAAAQVVGPVDLYPSFGIGGGAVLYGFGSGQAAALVADLTGLPPANATAISLTSYGNNEEQPVAASNGTDYLVAWFDRRGVSGSGSIYASRIAGSGGAPIDSAGVLVSGASAYNSYPLVAASPTEYLVAWFSNYKLLGARVSAASGAITSQPLLNPRATVEGAALAFDGDRFVIAWSNAYGGALHAVHKAPGDPVSADAGWLDLPGKGYAYEGPAAAGGSDQALVAWSDTSKAGARNIMGTRLHGDAGVLDPAGILIGTSTGNQTNPAAAWGGSEYLVAWESWPTDAGADIVAARVKNGAVLDRPGLVLASGAPNQFNPAVSGDDAGFVVVWQEKTDGGVDLKGSRVTHEGKVVGPFVVSAEPRNEQAPALASAGGETLVAYSRLVEAAPASNRRVLTRRITPLANGATCGAAFDCASGNCVDGVCCDTACGGGAADDCQACSAAAGASVNGTCAALDAKPCNDKNLCTRTDTCAAGVCKGADPVVCAALDQCHGVGVCAPSTGVCSQPALADGTGCDDQNACTTSDACKAGACRGAAKTCDPVDECHAPGTCAPQSGTCDSPAKADGTACSAGACVAGSCQAPPPDAGASPTENPPPSGQAEGGCGCTSGAGLAPWAAWALACLVRRRRPRA